MATLTIQESETTAVDAYTISTQATTAYNDSFLKLGSHTGKWSGAYRTLLAFDVTSLPASSFVTDATLTITTQSTSAGNNGSAKLLRVVDDFDETASWTYASGTTKWTNPDGSTASEPTSTDAQGSISFTMSSGVGTLVLSGSELVSIINHAIAFESGIVRLMLKLDDDVAESDAGNIYYWSMKSSNTSTASDRPKLEIDYEATDTIVWSGAAGDGDLATAGNWEGGVVPNQYDNVHFSGTSASATTGTLTCQNFHVSKEFGHDLGTATTAITVNCDKGVLERENGRTNITFSTSNDPANKVTIARTPRSEGLSTIGGNITHLYVIEARGSLNIASASGISNIYACPKRRGGARLKIGQGVNANLVAAKDSRIESATALNSVYLTGRSTLEMTTTGGADTATGTVHLSHSTFKHKGTGSIAGNLNLYSGTYDLSESTVADHTMAAINMYGGTLDARNGLGTFDSSTLTGDWNYYGGSIIVDPGTTLTI